MAHPGANWQPCAGPLDRRQWLRIGGLSLGALSTGLSPNLAHLLAAEQAAANRTPSRRGRNAVDRDFSVILFWANGGPSHLDLFDLKPDAPAEYRGPFRPIRTNVPGLEITELLPQAGAAGRQVHAGPQPAPQAGRALRRHAPLPDRLPVRAANLQDAEFPDIGSVVAKQLDGRASDVPLFVANTKFYGGGPAYLGPAYAPFMPSPNPLTSTGNNAYDPVPLYSQPGSGRQLVDRRGRRADARAPPGAARTRSIGCRETVDTSGTMSAFDDVPPPGRWSCSPARARARRSTCRAKTKPPAAATATRTGARACSPAGDWSRPACGSCSARPTSACGPRPAAPRNWDDHSVNSAHLQGLRGEAARASTRRCRH